MTKESLDSKAVVDALRKRFAEAAANLELHLVVTIPLIGPSAAPVVGKVLNLASAYRFNCVSTHADGTGVTTVVLKLESDIALPRALIR